jgi:NhaP-type Na+/H+ and K+/H+ antiporter
VREGVIFLWTGLKGAVPILLGLATLSSGTASAAAAYRRRHHAVGGKRHRA